MARHSYRQLHARAYQDAQKRVKDTAFKRVMLAVRGGYEPPAREVKLLRPGDLAEFLAARDAARNRKKEN